MRFRILGAVLAISLSLIAFQRRQRSFQDEEDNPSPMPPDASEKTEFAFARLRYSNFRGSYWRYGSWAIDYPKADRQFVQGVRRLTRIHTRSVEEVIDINSDQIFQWPWIYAVEEWDVFVAGMQRVFPDRPIVDLENKDPIFHVLYDLDERFQVPGIQYFYSGRVYEQDGVEPRWRGIYDDKGRIMVAVCHNMDLGDAWEWADHPRYPERYASLAYRVGINNIIYAMTH
jgi:hypothetical protein